MLDASQYELVDFGAGRKLERFGERQIDRPAPAAESAQKMRAEAWQGAIRFERTERDRGRWIGAGELGDEWIVEHEILRNRGRLRFGLKLTPFGHVGLFPEQAAHWPWLDEQCRRAGRPLKVLNLFAYTGGSTLAAAVAGASVVHIDAAENTVAWARRNAELSGLAAAPIRWIVEDAAKFVEREIKRGNHYDAVILDPPSYGHGPNAETWHFERQIGPLLADCAKLTAGERAFMLLTCHTPGVGPREAAELLAESLGQSADEIEAADMTIEAADGRKLHCGVAARWLRR